MAPDFMGNYYFEYTKDTVSEVAIIEGGTAEVVIRGLNRSFEFV